MMLREQFDEWWELATLHEPEGLDVICEIQCEEMEPMVADVPTWEQLSPLYA